MANKLLFKFKYYVEVIPIQPFCILMQVTYQEYEVLELLGKGSTSFVYKVQVKETGEIFALKVVGKEGNRGPEHEQKVRNEIRILKMINCPQIIKLMFSFEDDQNFYMLFEHCNGREIFQELKAKDCGFEEEEAAYIMKQIVQGILYLQKIQILHRDLKLSNILITKERNIKIIDFGLGLTFKEIKEQEKSQCGTPNYIPPEVISQKLHYKSDLWSLGCLFYALLTKAPPFEAQHTRLVIQRISAGKYSIPSYVSPEASKMIQSMLQVNPEDRLDIQEIASLPFLKKSLKFKQQFFKDQNLEESEEQDADLELQQLLGFQTLNADEEGKNEEKTDSRFSTIRTGAETPAFHLLQESTNAQNRKSKGKVNGEKAYKDNVMKQLEFGQVGSEKQRRQSFSQLQQKINQKITSLRSSIQESNQPHQASAPQQIDNLEYYLALEEKKCHAEKENAPQKQNTEVRLSTKGITGSFKHPFKDQDQSYIKLNKKGQVIIKLSKQMKKITISDCGDKINMKSFSKRSYEIEYKFERLPSKLKPWYKYAMDFVQILRSSNNVEVLRP